MTPQPWRLPQPLTQQRLELPAGASETYAFNPTVLASGVPPVCLFRTVDGDGRRRVRRCRLEAGLNATRDAIDWTAEIARLDETIAWVADPKAFTALGRHFVSFNTGHSERPNRLFVVEVDADGRPVDRPLEARVPDRRLIEKNWGFFGHGGELLALYSLSPLVVLRCMPRAGVLDCEPVFRHEWNAEPVEGPFGPLHGGPCPVHAAGRLLAVAQSRTSSERSTYRGTLLALEEQPPFAPIAVAASPLFALDAEERALVPPARLNPRVRECLYPAGLLHDAGSNSVTLTYGLNDYRAGLRVYRLGDLTRCLVPVTLGQRAEVAPQPAAEEPTRLVRTFYWRPERSSSGSVEEVSAGRFVHGNVGDALQVHLIAALFGRRAFHATDGGRRLLGAGSIAHRAQAGDVIWGSGFKNVPLRLTDEEKASIDVVAVRGPLTATYLASNGVDTSSLRRFLDPGQLVASIFAAQVEDCRRRAPRPEGVLLVPHYAHTAEFARRFPAHRVRDVDCDLFVLLSEILAAELVVSSSLHGLVFAEALGVPALLMQPPSCEPFTKYEDYYLGTGRPSFPTIDDPRDAARTRVLPPPGEPAGWRDDVPLLRALLPGRVEQMLHCLNHLPAYSRARDADSGQPLLFDIGRYAGDHVEVEIEIDGADGRPTSVQAVSTGTGAVVGTTEVSGRSASLIVDGNEVEAGGRLLALTVLDQHGGVATVTAVRARFPPW
jgi:hypothetical protein